MRASFTGPAPVVEQRHRQRAAVYCWTLAVGFAVALKWYFSAAATSELGWMLQPLAFLLRTLTGWRFERTPSGDVQSADAGIVLIKACAGINFMVLSFLGWCWAWLPQPGNEREDARSAWSWPARLAAALLCAWLTTLAVNALRILAIVHVQPQLEHWFEPTEAHRLIGLLIYLPALLLQWVLADWRAWRRALLAGCALYAVLMLCVPLATGNAEADWNAYVRHAGWVLALLLPPALLALAGRAPATALSRRSRSAIIARHFHGEGA